MVGNNVKDGIKKLINFLEEFVVEKRTFDFRNMWLVFRSLDHFNIWRYLGFAVVEIWKFEGFEFWNIRVLEFLSFRIFQLLYI